MDVNSASFFPLALDIFADIADAHFVAFDLELSGIPTKQFRNDAGKPSLQERYLETKEAAERYQILQIGLTCVIQDVENGKYILKPYNFDLCPIIAEKGLDIERIFSFQSGAAEFLLKAGFDLGRPFHHGVPYLSRLETKEARENHAKRQDRAAVVDIQIKPTEVDSLAFLDRIRKQVDAWLAQKNAAEYININPVSTEPVKNDQPMDEMSRYEKRLVHQLVRAEYPDLVTISKRSFIQIVRFDKAREDKIQAERKKELEERISRQKGFRWVIEALVGGSLSKFNVRLCARDPITGQETYADLDDFDHKLRRAQSLTRNRPRILVGHNCFLDLVYIYSAFIGKLPDTVTEFQRQLHELWPVIVDTKYMSTHDCSDINPISSLEQIATQLSKQSFPSIEVDPEHSRYFGRESFHEAGYDSYLTAHTVIRLSTKLEKEGGYEDVPTQSNGGNPSSRDSPESVQTVNGTNMLNDMNEPFDEGFVPSDPNCEWQRRGDPTITAKHDPNDPFPYNPIDLRPRTTHLDQLAEHKLVADGMPRFGSEFWRVYGNKLRVFGTQEAVCVLESSTSPSSDAEDGGVAV